jgi:hypothetical protein
MIPEKHLSAVGTLEMGDEIAGLCPILDLKSDKFTGISFP